jgi:phosphoenolpyruvate synthase/pyruvate phosphate dikinase
VDDPASGGGPLGEERHIDSLLGARVPEGFALTKAAYRDALGEAGAWEELRRLLSNFDHHVRSAASSYGSAATSDRDHRERSTM